MKTGKQEKRGKSRTRKKREKKGKGEKGLSRPLPHHSSASTLHLHSKPEGEDGVQTLAGRRGRRERRAISPLFPQLPLPPPSPPALPPSVPCLPTLPPKLFPPPPSSHRPNACAALAGGQGGGLQKGGEDEPPRRRGRVQGRGGRRNESPFRIRDLQRRPIVIEATSAERARQALSRAPDAFGTGATTGGRVAPHVARRSAGERCRPERT